MTIFSFLVFEVATAFGIGIMSKYTIRPCFGFRQPSRSDDPVKSAGFTIVCAESMRNMAAVGPSPHFPRSAIGVSSGTLPSGSYLVFPPPPSSGELQAPVLWARFNRFAHGGLTLAAFGTQQTATAAAVADAASVTSVAAVAGEIAASRTTSEAVEQERNDDRVIRSGACAGFVWRQPGDKSAYVGSGLCCSCLSIVRGMNKRYLAAVDKREHEPDRFEPHTSVAQSPTRSMQRMRLQSEQVRLLKIKNRGLASQLRQREGIIVAGDNDLLDDIFIETEVKGMAELVAMGFDEASLEAQIFAETVENAKRAKKAGGKRQACRLQ